MKQTMMQRSLFKGGDVAADIREKYGFDGDLLDLFVTNKGPKVHKWHHFIPLYDRYFGPYRNRPVRFLEIGVAQGGSQQLWRRYFGPEAVIFGIDINPDCKAYDGLNGQVRIGSQDDPAFLDAVVAEMGGLDLVLDDGSHRMSHIMTTLKHLFPKVADGGVYMIEDLHSAYIKGFEGGLTAPGNFFNDLRGMIDDMHHWYHGGGQNLPQVSSSLTGIHVHDSIVVLDKAPTFAPVRSLIG